MESETGKQNTDINSEIQSCQPRFFVYRSPKGRIKKTGTPKFEMLGKSVDKKVAGNRGSLAFFLPFLWLNPEFLHFLPHGSDTHPDFLIFGHKKRFNHKVTWVPRIFDKRSKKSSSLVSCDKEVSRRLSHKGIKELSKPPRKLREIFLGRTISMSSFWGQ